MAVIDTLKLARALRDKGGFSQEAAEATAEALDSAFDDAAATKADLARIEAILPTLASKAELAAMELRLIKWLIGVGIAATLTVAGAVGGMIWTATQVLLRALPPHP